MIRKFFVAVGLATALLTAGPVSAQEPLRIAIEGAFPPFSYITPEGLQGFDVDIAKALCEEMQRECELKQQSWDGIISGLLVRKYDAIVASMSITEERKKTVDFSDPYWFAPSRFLALKGQFADDRPATLAKAAIGVQRGTIQEDYLTGVYPAVEIRRYENQEEAMLDLAARRVEAVLAPNISVLEFLGSEDGRDFDFFGRDHSDPAYFGIGAGIAVRKEDGTLRHALNAALKRLMETGRYQEINAKYFTESIRPR